MVHSMDKKNDTADHRAASISRSTIPVGFHELAFVDFSTEKFPLVARTWCEENPRRASSNFHNFMCPDCDKSFPCKSALAMHCSTHTPEYSNVCDTCDSTFPNAQAKKIHALSHVGPKVVNSFTKVVKEDSDKELHDKVSKEEFLAVLDLKTSHSKVKDTQEEYMTKRVNEDKRVNQDYFIKLGQASNPKNNASAWLKQAAAREYVDENSNDFADIHQIIKVSSKVDGLPKVMTSTLPLQRQQALALSMTISDMPKLQRMPPPLLPRPQPIVVNQPPPLKLMPEKQVKTEIPDEDGGVPMTSLTNGHYNFLNISPKDDMDRDLPSNQNKNGDLFVCGFCNESFTNYRAYKGKQLYLKNSFVLTYSITEIIKQI